MTLLPSSPSRPRLLLVGAGHAHLHTLKQTRVIVEQGFEVVLVAPGPCWYSGLATGMLGGMYPPEEDQVSVRNLVVRGGGQFIQDEVVRIDSSARLVALKGGENLSYDVLSLNLGSVVPLDELPGAGDQGYPVKPISNLWLVRETLERLLAQPQESPPRVVIVGGGPTGCEITANVLRLAATRGKPAHVTLMVKGERLAESFPEGASAILLENLQRRGAEVLTGAPVARVDAREVVTVTGQRVPFDVIIYATGLRPPPLLRETGLPTNEEGGLRVDDHLRCVTDPRIFGVGDCVTFGEKGLPRVGVFAVRQAPVLSYNLLAALQGRPLRRYRPQRRYLLILNLGDRTGLAVWNGWYWHGRSALWLKEYLDRRFLKRYT